jgi:hypothetical protein
MSLQPAVAQLLDMGIVPILSEDDADAQVPEASAPHPTAQLTTN